MNESINPKSAIPAGWHAVTPRIVAKDVEGLVTFIRHVFSADGDYDDAAPTIVTVGDSKIMVSEAGGREAHAAMLYVYVDDVEATYLRALDHSVTIVEAPLDTPYGDRRCIVRDAWGNIWQIARHGAN